MKDITLSNLRIQISDYERIQAIHSFGEVVQHAKKIHNQWLEERNLVTQKVVRNFEYLELKFAEDLYSDLLLYPDLAIMDFEHLIWVKKEVRERILTKFITCDETLDRIKDFVNKIIKEKGNVVHH